MKLFFVKLNVTERKLSFVAEEVFMKKVRLVISIASLVLFVIITVQAFMAGSQNAVMDAFQSFGDWVSGLFQSLMDGRLNFLGGLFLGLTMLVSGVFGLATKRFQTGAIVAGVVYLGGGFLASAFIATYPDLTLWSWLSFAFGALFVLSGVLNLESETELSVKNDLHI